MRPRRLAQSSGQSVLLTLPQGWSTDELTWISVWCRRFGVNFGDLIIPEEEEEEIGGVDLDEILGADGDDDFEDEDEAVEGEDQDLVFLGDLTSYEHDVQVKDISNLCFKNILYNVFIFRAPCSWWTMAPSW